MSLKELKSNFLVSI